MTMVEWVWDLYGLGKILEAADPILGGEYEKQQMECLMHLTFHQSRRQAINKLNFEAAMPILPPKMPVLSYIAPVVDITAMTLKSPYTAIKCNGFFIYSMPDYLIKE